MQMARGREAYSLRLRISETWDTETLSFFASLYLVSILTNSICMSEDKATGRGYYIGKKLEKLLAERGLKKNQLAKRAGISPGTITDLIKNRHAASPKNLKKIAQALGVPQSYFIEEEPPKEYPPTPEVVEREYIAIPIITGVGAGGEVITDNYTLIKRSQLPRKTLSAFEVQGDSMDPTIPKDWFVLIDSEDTELQSGKVYLFARSGGPENGLVIRRVFKENDDWVMVPDNRKYPPEKLTDEWRIVGRVVQKMPKMEPISVE